MSVAETMNRETKVRLRWALQPLANIADAYDNNELDNEARRFWDGPPDQIELYSGRDGKCLLTMQDCFNARKALNQLED